MVANERIELDERMQAQALICPGCEEPAEPERPAWWEEAWGPVADWSHRDGSPLCRSQAIGVPAEPVELGIFLR